jgi:O-antigen/teichoic acid export membrane protein
MKKVGSSHARSTVVNLLFQYAQTVYLIVFGIVLTPVYISQIPLDIYGAWLATGNVAAWLGMLDPGLHYVVQQRLASADAVGDIHGISTLRNQSYFLSAIIAAAIMLLGLVSVPVVERYVVTIGCSDPRQLGLAFAMAACGTGITVLACGVAVVNAGLQCHISHGISFLLAQTANLCAVVALLCAGWGVLAIPSGVLAQAGVMAAANAVFTSSYFRKRGIPFTTDLGDLRSLVTESSGTVMARIAGCLSGQVDMLLAASFLGPSECVAISVTSKGPSTALTFAQRVSHASMPTLSAIDARNDSAQRTRAVELLLLATIWTASAAAGGTLFLNRGFVASWVGENLYLGPFANVIIAIGLLSVALETTFANVLVAFGEYRSHGRIQLLKSVLAAFAGLLLLPLVGAVGLLAASTISAMLTTWRVFPSLMADKCRWSSANWTKLLAELARSVAAALIAGSIAALLPQHNAIAFMTSAVAFCLAYFASLSALSSAFRKVVKPKKWISLALNRPGANFRSGGQREMRSGEQNDN